MQKLKHEVQNELINKLSSSVPVQEQGSGEKSAAAAIIGTVLSSVFTNFANDSRVERQNRLNLEQWYRENAYNSPAAQMQRLRQAGINPALAFANGDMMNEAAASPQMMANRVTSPVNIDPLTAAQIKNLDAQTESISHQTDREDEKQPVVVQQLRQTLDNTRQELRNMVEELRGIRDDNDRKEAELSIIDSTLNYVIAQRKYEALMTQDQYTVFLRGLLADIGVKEAREPYYRSLKLLTDEQKKQVEFLVESGREYFNAERPYLKANARNEYVSLYWSTKKVRLASSIFDKYKDADWWIKTVGGTLIDAGEAVGHGFGSGLRGKSSRSGVPGSGPGQVVYPRY